MKKENEIKFSKAISDTIAHPSDEQERQNIIDVLIEEIISELTVEELIAATMLSAKVKNFKLFPRIEEIEKYTSDLFHASRNSSFRG